MESVGEWVCIMRELVAHHHCVSLRYHILCPILLALFFFFLFSFENMTIHLHFLPLAIYLDSRQTSISLVSDLAVVSVSLVPK